MSFETLNSVIRERFDDEVATPESLPVQWPNTKPVEPNGGMWARVTVREGETEQRDLGVDPNQRTRGVVFFQLFTPAGTGDGVILELADKVAAAFRRTTASGVRFRTPSIRKGGRERGDWMVLVSCPFYYDD